jgi:hypothetical protein
MWEPLVEWHWVYDTMVLLQAAINPGLRYANFEAADDGRLTLLEKSIGTHGARNAGLSAHHCAGDRSSRHFIEPIALAASRWSRCFTLDSFLRSIWPLTVVEVSIGWLAQGRQSRSKCSNHGNC